MRKMSKNSMLLVLAASLVIGVVLVGGCGGNGTQIIENLTPQEAFTLIEDNQDNLGFVILDVSTPEEFAERHIENATNIDYYSATFRDELDNLDKDKVYLVYCPTGMRSGASLAIMEELDFVEVYNMLGGIDAWQEEELPVIAQEGLPATEQDKVEEEM